MVDHEQGDTSVLTTLFRNNAWASLKLLDFCEGLSSAQLDTAAIGGFGSIRATLIHIVNGELSYIERVNGKVPPQPLSEDEFVGFAVLKATVRWAGDELLQLALATQQSSIVREHFPGVRLEYPLASLLVQAVGHATEHRTHITTIITQLGIEPPDLSGWNYMVEQGEYLETYEQTGEA